MTDTTAGAGRRWSVRARVAGITAALLAAVLVPGALVLALAVAMSERAALDGQLHATGAEVATLVEENRLPTTLPVAGARMVQVVEPDGTVEAASPSADRMVALLSPQEIAEVEPGESVEVSAGRIAEAGTMRVLALPAGPETRGRIVLVAAPVPDTSAAQRALWVGLATGVALVVALGAGLSWRAVGAALQPVEALRRGADGIGQGARDARHDTGPARLPVPATRDEVAALAITLNGMLDRLDAAATAQRRFVSDAAHELRSPLASLRMQIEVAQRLENSELANELSPDVDRLGRLVDDLLLLARAGSASPTRRPEPVDLADLVAEVCSRYGHARVPARWTRADRLDQGVPNGPGGGADRLLQQGPDGPVVWADRLALDRVLSNLLDNAVRHAATEVVVAVGTTDERGEGVIEVVDDGAGIPEAQRERVFDRFVRLDEGRDRDAGGSGLGLSIVRELIRGERGTVTLHDARPGVRARITLREGTA
ncbi:MAG: HAMP domain-containing sensor histidine kinase [Mobilicoccus sp.]|nr:HAMP domain-containing sensor histidine kinase [Mobilicoccus sp.]